MIETACINDKHSFFLITQVINVLYAGNRLTAGRIIDPRYRESQANVKPKPRTEGKKGWVCKICGYVYEGDELPDDIVCPLCKHGAADFEPIG